MENNEKGLFGRLLDFWKEKISISERGRIGFWNGAENVENHFAEMGAVAALSQQETKKAFWEEAAAQAEKTVSAGEILEKQKKVLRGEAAEREKEGAKSFAEAEMTEKKQRTNLFSAEILRESKQTEEKESTMGRAFFAEPEKEEREKRSIVPVSAEVVQEEKVHAAEEEKMPEKEIHKKEETQTESVIDIEGLMRHMTKKLWEERESCGRRLR